MYSLPNKAPSWRVTDIYEKHYASKAKDQREYLVRMAYSFLQPKASLEELGWLERIIEKFSGTVPPDYFPEDCHVTAMISPFHVERLVRAYWIDIIRYKEYHYNPANPDVDYAKYADEIHNGGDMRRLGHDKIAAYLVKWILKSQPIQVDLGEMTDTKDPKLNDLIWYVNCYFALVIACDQLKVNLASLDASLRSDLLYHFRFRPYDESAFTHIFKSLM